MSETNKIIIKVSSKEDQTLVRAYLETLNSQERGGSHSARLCKDRKWETQMMVS